MIRFKNEFIFFNGECQFVATINEILDFQKKCLFINNFGCCKLCAFRDFCIKKCLVDRDHILVNIKYFELYKDWKNQYNND